MLETCLLGTGGMMPLPYRWLTSLMVRYNGMSILIDAGEGTQIAMKKKGWSPKPIDVICFTHFHADHISGLPGLLLSMGNAERETPLLLIGPKGLARVVNSLRVIAPELPFEIVFHELSDAEEQIRFTDLPEFAKVRPEDSASFRDLHLTAFRVNHNVTCYGYSLKLDRAGRFDAGKAIKLAIPQKYWSLLQKGQYIREADGTALTDEEKAAFEEKRALQKEAPGASGAENTAGGEAAAQTADTEEEAGGRILMPDMVLGPARRGLKITYTTDTRPCDAIRRNAADSDLFICEGMYGETDKLSKAKEHKHMIFAEAAKLARDAGGVKELWLTHYSPALVRPEDFLPETKKIFPNTIAAKDGRSTDLMFEED